MQAQDHYPHLNESELQLITFIILIIVFNSASGSGDPFNMNDESFINVWKGRIGIEEKDGKKIFSFSKKELVKILDENNIPSDIINDVRSLPDFGGEEFKLILSDDGVLIRRLEPFLTELGSVLKEMKGTYSFLFDEDPLEDKRDNLLTDISSTLQAWCLFSKNYLTLDKPGSIVDTLQAVLVMYYYCLAKFFGINRVESDFKTIQIVADWLNDSLVNRVTVGLTDLKLMPFVFAELLNGVEVDIQDWTKSKTEKYLIYLVKSVADLTNRISPKFNKLTIDTNLEDAVSTAFIGDQECLSRIQGNLEKYDRSAIMIEEEDFKGFNDLSSKVKRNFIYSVDKALKLNKKKTGSVYYFFSSSRVLQKFEYTDYSFGNHEAGLKGKFYSPEEYVFIKSLINRAYFSSYIVDKEFFFKSGEECASLSAEFFKSIGSEENEFNNALFKDFYYKEPSAPGVFNRLENCASIIRGQVLSSGNSNSPAFELNPGDISESGLILNVGKIIPKNDYEKNEKYRIKKGDILVGVKGLVGRVGFMDREVNNLYAGQAIAIVRVNKDSIYPPEFFFSILKTVFSSENTKAFYLSENSKSIVMSNFRKMVLPFPDRYMDEYVERVEQLFSVWKRALKLNDSLSRDLNSIDMNYQNIIVPEFKQQLKRRVMKDLSSDR